MSNLNTVSGIDLSTVDMTNPAVQKMVAELQALQEANANLKKKKIITLSMKVSQKGAVSVYGLQRFPVTLYGNQWERLLARSEDIKDFIIENAGDLTVKD